MKNLKKFSIIFLLLFFNLTTFLRAEVIKSIEVLGNNRISKNTIIQFTNIKLDEDVSAKKLNNIVKDLYDTDFFSDIKISLNRGILKIEVVENAIIQSLRIDGIKKKSLLEFIEDNLSLKEKNSYTENSLKKDEEKISNILRANGYYFADVISKIKQNDNNTLDLIYEIDLGEKAFIKRIKFLGDKKFKERKLKSIIISEEQKFWKFISNKKYLDLSRISLDEKLLKSFYKNNGFFNVSVDSSSAKLLNKENFELIFNINAGERFYFNKLNLTIPDEYSQSNFEDIKNLFVDLEDEIYSLNKIEKIIKEIDKIVLQKEFEFISASYSENVVGKNKIDIIVSLNELEKKYVERINIYGNYITEEKVIRNRLIVDEGDPLNDILLNKSLNEIKSLNIFGKVTSNIEEGSDSRSKIVNINLEEKPTGEIAAGAGTGTSGSSVSFSIKENNYLGRGIKLKSALALSDTQVKGSLIIDNPNYKNSDRSLKTTIESVSTDNMSRFGYKSDKTGFSFGTTYEQYDDLYFSPSISNYYEDLETSSTASNAKKKQAGSHFETAVSYGLTLNKLNQNFHPTDGFSSSFYQTLPLISEDYSLENTYLFAKYHSLENDMVLSFKFYAKAVTALGDEDTRITKRIYIPSNRLRGFESGKIGPKDSGDYIGGNYGSAINFTSTLPQLLENLETIDLSLFLDAANVWGVDYDDNLDQSKVRTSTGLAIDWFTPIGPLSFSFAKPITKADSDVTETFRFQIGTTF